MKKFICILFLGLVLMSCGCTDQSGSDTSTVQVTAQTETPTEAVEESILPIYAAGDVVARNDDGYLVILAVNNGSYTIRWAVQDTGESVPGHFEVSLSAEEADYATVHTLATGVYKQVNISDIDVKNTAFAEQHYADTIEASEAQAAAEAEALANYEGALPGTYLIVSASHKWDLTLYLDGDSSSKTGTGQTRINVPEGTEHLSCWLDLEFDDYYNSGSETGWVQVKLYGPNSELIEEGKSATGLSSYVHITHFF